MWLWDFLFTMFLQMADTLTLTPFAMNTAVRSFFELRQRDDHRKHLLRLYELSGAKPHLATPRHAMRTLYKRGTVHCYNKRFHRHYKNLFTLITNNTDITKNEALYREDTTRAARFLNQIKYILFIKLESNAFDVRESNNCKIDALARDIATVLFLFFRV